MRISKQKRKTEETAVELVLNLDGGVADINTGVGFFDHMLNAFAVHGGFGLELRVNGDTNVDCHHTVEDTGIVLGKAFSEALGGKQGIKRYGNFTIPMDETLAECSLDISNRPFLVFNADFFPSKLGEYDPQMTEEFFRAFAFNAGITLHINVIYGKNDHHKTEAIFKAAAHALKEAVAVTDENLTTKGVI